MREFIAVLLGALFGLGLMLSGMTNPDKVTSFLDVFGRWDPSLALVMVGAIAVASLGYRMARHRARAWMGDPVDIPKNNLIDRRLILGGLLFGTGWGIAGLCPGPALVNLGAGDRNASLFVCAMLIGMLGHDYASRWISGRRAMRHNPSREKSG